LLPAIIIARCDSCLHDVTKQGCKLHTVTQNKLCTVLVRSLHHFGATLLVNRFFLFLASYRSFLARKSNRKPLSCKLSRKSGSSCVLCWVTALVLCCAVAVTGTSNPCLGSERSEAWKAERSGCKRERAGSTSMEASPLSAAGAPSTPLWTVGYRDWLAASSGRGSATAPSCVGYTCTPQHHSSSASHLHPQNP